MDTYAQAQAGTVRQALAVARQAVLRAFWQALRKHDPA